MQHEIYLNRYMAQPEDLASYLKLGTAESHGNEQLLLHPGTDWQGLVLTATFHPPGGGEAVRMLAVENLVDVPPEATATAGMGQIVFAGLVDGARRISCNLTYRVQAHEGAEGGAEAAVTPSVLEQAVLAAAASAKAAAESAEAAAASAENIDASEAAAAASAAAAAASAGKAAASETTAGERAAAAAMSAEAAEKSRVAAEAAAQNAADAAEDAIKIHNADPYAHPGILVDMQELSERIFVLEISLGGDAQNKFTVNFGTLEDIVATGIWDQTLQRVVF